MKRIMAAILAVCVVSGAAGGAWASGGFADVPAGSWYAEAVDFVTANGFFNGVGEQTFDPAGGMTRGMFITVLGRMAGLSADQGSSGVITKSSVNLRTEPNTSSGILAVLAKDTAVSVLGLSQNWYQVRVGTLTGYVRSDLMRAYTGNFSDVAAGTYYSPYVQWAYMQGLVSGTTDTAFSPDAPISREQICAILYHYITAFGIPLQTNTAGTSFADDGQIASWARTAVYTLQGAGVLNGRDGNSFVPQGGATRAEVAVILQRFVAAIGGLENIPNPDARFGAPLPESSPVSDSYFDDACLIGNSLVVGMSTYFRLPNADFYAVTGIAASTLLTYADFELERTETGEDGKERPATGTLAEALDEKTGAYKKVYIMLGTNELGPESYHLSSYAASMRTLIALVRESQPDAKIYVIATPPVSQARSEEDTRFNRENVRIFNTKLLEISSEESVYYIDAYSLLADAEGYLPAESCLSDGIHILAPQYAALKEYLKTHTA